MTSAPNISNSIIQKFWENTFHGIFIDLHEDEGKNLTRLFSFHWLKLKQSSDTKPIMSKPQLFSFWGHLVCVLLLHFHHSSSSSSLYLAVIIIAVLCLTIIIYSSLTCHIDCYFFCIILCLVISIVTFCILFLLSLFVFVVIYLALVVLSLLSCCLCLFVLSIVCVENILSQLVTSCAWT